ncbi:MAG: FAD-dependent oxidoreductase [Dehalococcoidia bacterium]
MLPVAFDASKRLPAPCVVACPAQIDIPRYIGYVEQGKFDEAHAVVRESIPLPVVCGLICYRPCEPWCRRGIMEQPVAINAIKRAAVEHDSSLVGPGARPPTPAPATGKRVAVVGSGPAGLTAAYYLASRRGHAVTLFDAMPEVGGQLRIGLPEYKVPRDRLRREVERVTATRVEVRTGVWVDSLDALTEEFDAVLLAIGHGQALPLDIDGEELPGVGVAADFLRDVNLGKPWAVGKRVAVIGGNNIAFDSARCAVRLGAETVLVVIPVPEDEAPAYDFEVRSAVEEGVRVEPLQRPRKIVATGRGPERQALAVEMERLEVVETDSYGRSKVAPVAGDAFTIEVDTVLVSMGQRPKVPPFWGLALTRDGLLEVDGESLLTGREGVYAAGDAVTGPDSIVEAMAQGKRAAVSIDRALGGDGDISESFAPEFGAELAMPAHLAQQGKEAPLMPGLDAGRRRGGFDLVELGYGREDAIAEARRCIRCDLWRAGAPDVWSHQQG